jgi:hypothetical protein
MLIISLFSSLLPLASIALAGPVKRAESLHIRNFFVEYANDGTGALQFALHSSVAGLNDECVLAWYVVRPIFFHLPHTISNSSSILFHYFDLLHFENLTHSQFQIHALKTAG